MNNLTLARPARAMASSTPSPAGPALAASPASGLAVYRVPCLSDNYAWLLVDESSGVTGVVDPGEAGPVAAAVDAAKTRSEQLGITSG